MRYIILAAIFLLIPYFFLMNVVMPHLQALQEVYRNADSFAAKVVEKDSARTVNQTYYR